MPSTSPRIAIIGAGIGGLTAAIGLRRAGFEVEVHERATELCAVGAGLTIQPNAVRALRLLGIGERLERAGAALRVGGLLHHDGVPISALPRAVGEALLSEAGAPILGIHRASLQEHLLAELGRDVLRLGRTCVGYELHGGGVSARYADGSRATYDALVGADGMRSAIRAQLVQDGEPVYAGYTSWRGVTSDRCGLAADFGGEMWGRGQRFGGCAIDGERFYWFAVANAPAGERDLDKEAAKAQLLARFADWAHFVPELIRSTPAAAILRTDIADRPPLSRWGDGCVTLLGDAAHAMTPNLGQGACQAIEDALVLSRELTGADSIERGLRGYEAARRDRANAVLVTSRKLGAVAQWQNPVACALRNTLFRAMPASMMKKQMLDAWKLPYA